MNSMLKIRDVLRPNIINVNGRKYRHLPQKSYVNVDDNRQQDQLETYIEEDRYYYEEPESCTNDYDNLEKTEDGFKCSLKDIPSEFFGFIIGKQGSKKTSIEKETRTKLIIPRKGKSGDIVITGKSRSDVLASRTKIETIIEMHRGDLRPDHFLCIPLWSPDLPTTCRDFERDVLKLNSRGVHPSIFQSPERFHLTLCMTSFLNEQEIKDAIPKIKTTAQKLKGKYFGEEDIQIVLRGVEYMNDDPEEVDVLYAKVHLKDQSDKLQKFVDEMLECLSNENFMKRQHETCKLHTTVMNTLFRDGKKSGQKMKDRVTFDARAILEKFKDHFFGEMQLKSLDISVKGSYDKEGRYNTAASVSFDKS